MKTVMFENKIFPADLVELRKHTDGMVCAVERCEMLAATDVQCGACGFHLPIDSRERDDALTRAHAWHAARVIWSRVAKGTTPVRPPLGIMPRKYWIKYRVEDLARALDEHKAAGLPAKEEWINELAELMEKA